MNLFHALCLSDLIAELCLRLPIIGDPRIFFKGEIMFDRLTQMRFVLILDGGLVVSFSTDNRGNVIVRYILCFTYEDGDHSSYKQIVDDDDFYVTFEEILIILQDAQLTEAEKKKATNRLSSVSPAGIA